MDGILSQDEINALLSGMDLSGDTPPENLSELLPASGAVGNADYLSGTGPVSGGDELLSDVEKDAIGEVANISMGASATSLYSLVNRKVDISTPVVSLTTWDKLIEEYEKPCVFIQIKYTKGLDGSNILVLKEQDVKVITSLMMGMDGTPGDGPLEELHLSAISEAMNMMMGSSATSLSTMLQTTIDISPPISSLLNLSELKSGGEIAPFLDGTFVKISFRMQIGDLVDSKIMQLYPVEFAKKLVETFINTQLGITGDNNDSGTNGASQPVQASSQGDPVDHSGVNMNSGDMGFLGLSGMNDTSMGGMNGMGMNGMNMNGMNSMGMNGMNMNGMNGMGMNGMNMNGMNMNGMNGMGMNGMNMNGMNGMGMGGMNGMGMNGMNGMNQGMPNVNVQPAQFQSFSQDAPNVAGHENINLIMDVPLEVTVELGRTTKSISDILNFAPGTIIDLNRIAGEPIDVLVNGKFVARGEVVVIEENFGVRVTEIIK